MPSRMPNSLRKYIRKEKARIRREVFDIIEQKNKIQELRERFVRNEKPQDSVTTDKLVKKIPIKEVVVKAPQKVK